MINFKSESEKIKKGMQCLMLPTLFLRKKALMKAKGIDKKCTVIGKPGAQKPPKTTALDMKIEK